MRENLEYENSGKAVRTTAGALSLLLALAFLVGCQGLSAGNSNQQTTTTKSLPSTLAFASNSLSFGSVAVGSTKATTFTASNSGSTSITISSVAITSQNFLLASPALPITLAAGQKTPIGITFTPSAAGAFSATATIVSNASNPTAAIALTGSGTNSVTAGQLALTPTSESFGSVIVGNNQVQTVTLTNSGSANVDISQVSVSGSGFSLSGIAAPLTLTAGQIASFSVTFAPTSAGNATGTVTIISDASSPTLTIPLSGTGAAVGALGSGPSSLSFGSVTVDSNQSLAETVTNTGGSSVTISQVAISGTGFTLSGVTTPVTLTAGQSASFNVEFAPTSAGSASGTVTVTSNASNSTLPIPLSGTGVALGALGSNPSSLTFGSVTVGDNQSLSGTVTNTGGSSVTISHVAIGGTGFSLSGITAPITLTAGQSTSFSVKFAPISADSASGTVTITSDASDPTLTIPLSGTGVALGALGSNPSSLSFGSVTVGDNQSLPDTVTNTGGSSVTISQVAISGTGFSVSGITAPVTLTAGQSTSFNVKFAPTSAGSASGTVTITSNASNPTLTIPLSATGAAVAGQLTVTPSTLTLGSVVVGTSGTASGSLNATGASVTVTAAGSNNSLFSISGLSLPVTIAAGNSLPFTVTFSPTTTGGASATLSFTSNAQTSPSTDTASGTGTAAPTHTVNLSWTASSSPDISGYNIYRAVYTTSCGSFSKINPALNTTTLYSDTVVVDGTNYCYATTAVNTGNEESGYSNIVPDVQIPAP
jgi:hypothetical protein